jgi:protein Mpv17
MRAGSPLTRLWNAYNASLKTHPVLTKSLTSTGGFIIGDTLAQVAVGGDEPYDWRRTARFATYGFAVHGPTCHLFYRWLDGMVVGTGARQVITKVATDQLLFTPVGVSLFYATLTTLEGRPQDIPEVINEKIVKTVLAGYMVWPAAHVVNFRFVPSDLRVLYINCVQMLWNTVLCQIASSKPPTTESEAAGKAMKEGITTGSAQ